MVVTLLAALGTYSVAQFYAAYPEAAPAPGWLIIATGATLWLASSFLISKLPDKR
jgi:hypothetical protein